MKTKKKTKRDIILICPGGCMSGIFGAGVLTAFQVASLYPRIKTIYAGSAGAMNSAYFLTRQLKTCSSIYYDDLTGEKFIKAKYVALAYWQKLLSRYVKKIPRNSTRQEIASKRQSPRFARRPNRKEF